MNNLELYHHGIKGMKWGIRRYQNKDGSLTAAGRKRYERDAKEKGWTMGDDGIARSGGKKNRKVEDPNASRWVKEDLERTKRLSDAGSNMTNQLRNVSNTYNKHHPQEKIKMDLSNMTDKEMRDQINRKLLERQYTDLFAEQNVSKGRENVGKVLEYAGSALAVTSSALGIALAIKELRG